VWDEEGRIISAEKVRRALEEAEGELKGKRKKWLRWLTL
jgi:hypothetical protein